MGEKLETGPRHDAEGDGDLGDPRRPRNLLGSGEEGWAEERQRDGRRQRETERQNEREKGRSAQTDLLRVRKVEGERLRYKPRVGSGDRQRWRPNPVR